MILLDTNLLTRMTRSHDPQSSVVRTAIQTFAPSVRRYLRRFGSVRIPISFHSMSMV